MAIQCKKKKRSLDVGNKFKSTMKGGFMLKRIFAIGFLVFCLVPLYSLFAQGDPNDAEGSKDPALFNRMPGFYITEYSDIDFDRFEFQIGPDKFQTVEGHHYYIDYYANDGIKIPSGLQVIANYTNAAKAIGGRKVYEFEDGGTQYVTLEVVKNNADVWVRVEAASNGMYKVNLVEKQGMKQDVVADAESLLGSIKETGKVAVYGILFDTGKSEIKPESQPTIGEIAKLLKANPALKLYVVGHTDNVGAFDYNIKLSQSRAAAVVDALVSKNGIAASRLIPFGDGPTAPVASNKSEEGRAMNRRVELVAQ
jgi:outer membrane protein OmpA-like peptidoglycan-associated protein